VNWGYINSMDAAGALLIAVLGAVILGALTFFRRR
jgi:MYXO-CTERM domain-containing protein